MKQESQKPKTAKEFDDYFEKNDIADLLFEAGHLKTPKLDKRIKQARQNFSKNKTVSWNKIKF